MNGAGGVQCSRRMAARFVNIDHANPILLPPDLRDCNRPTVPPSVRLSRRRESKPSKIQCFHLLVPFP